MTPGTVAARSAYTPGDRRDRGIVAILRSRNREVHGEHVVGVEARVDRGQRREGARQQDAADEQRQCQRDLGRRPGRCARAIDGRLPAVARLSSRVAAVRSERQACAAGSSAAIRPVIVRMAIDAASTTPLSAMFSTRGSPAGASGMNQAIAQAASAMPTAPPATSSGTISAIDCSATRPRVAPSASRTASSRFSQRRAPTAASTDSAPPPATGRAPRRASRRARCARWPAGRRASARSPPRGPRWSGRSAPSRAAMAFISALRLRHAHARLQPRDRDEVVAASPCAPVRAGLIGQRRPDLELAPGILKVGAHDADHRVRHAAQVDRAADDRRVGGEAAPPERIAEQHLVSLPISSSSSVKPRPSAGETPSTGSRLAEMRAASSRSGSLPSPIRLKLAMLRKTRDVFEDVILRQPVAMVGGVDQVMPAAEARSRPSRC